MNFLFVCAYAAPYKGNFISSLEKLEAKLVENGNKVIYAFTEKAKEQKWCKKIQERTKVYYLKASRFDLKTYCQIRTIYKNENIDVVHSHFELYDIPVSLMANKKIKIFWHLHDSIDFENVDFIHKILNKLQYKYLSKRAKLISVCEFYRKQIVKIGMKKENTFTLLNGIETSRIQSVKKDRKIQYDFYTFGWDYYRKGVDVIIKACEKLYKEKDFKLLLNGNESTWRELNKIYQNHLPSWLIKQDFVEDINDTIKQVGCFIQASRRETFSYAVGEMTFAGISVISSDIYGTQWAKELPTVKFFKNEDSEELCDLLKTYLENENNYNSLADFDTAKNIIEQKYSINNWVNQIMKIYNIKV